MIYLDNHATTPCDPDVLDAMLPYFTRDFGNPSSIHSMGQYAEKAISDAGYSLAALLNANASEFVFTSGATESNNLAILGVANSEILDNKRRTIVTTKTEHKAVLEPLYQLQNKGWKIDFLPVDVDGRIDLEIAERIITDDTRLVSVQFANSEIGTIQPIAELAQMAHTKNSIFHCDAAQAVGKVNIDIQDLDIDFLSLSGHKFYGPKGIGALWIKRDFESVLQPLMFGGSSKSRLRPGTMPVALIAGLGHASFLAKKYISEEISHLHNLRNKFEENLTRVIPNIKINGSTTHRLPNNSNITFPGVDAEAMLLNMNEIIASTGSACESGSIEPSRVLLEVGLSSEIAYQTIRFGFGKFNTLDEIEIATQEITDTYFALL